MHRVLGAMINSYRRSPVKPLKGALLRAYSVYRLMNRNRTVVATLDGITYELDLNETIDSAIYYEGCFEPDTTHAITRLCGPGMTVLDVGANIGAHTLRFARLVGPEGRVIAFEPMASAFSRLRRNVGLNAFHNITLEKLALSNTTRSDQEVALACSWPLSGVDDSLLHPIHRGRAMRDTVDFVTLDDYVRTKDVDRVDLIKLDVDGHEYKVVRGAAETLRRHRPLLIMELGVYSLAEAGDDIADLVSVLSHLGYHFYAEKGLGRFPGFQALRAAIPDNSTINVVVSVGDLSALRSRRSP